MRPVRSALLLSAGFGLGYNYRAKQEPRPTPSPESQKADQQFKAALSEFLRTTKTIMLGGTVAEYMGLTNEPVTVKFDKETSDNWMEESEANLLFLRSTQNYLNDILKARGHVFLNDVYDQLGLPRTSQGAVVGWLASEVPHGIEYAPEPDNEGAITLTFHVNGVIYDKLDT